MHREYAELSGQSALYITGTVPLIYDVKARRAGEKYWLKEKILKMKD